MLKVTLRIYKRIPGNDYPTEAGGLVRTLVLDGMHIQKDGTHVLRMDEYLNLPEDVYKLEVVVTGV